MLLTRRQMIATGAAAGAVAYLPLPASAALLEAAQPLSRAKRFKPVDLFAHHCSLVHAAMGERLERERQDGVLTASAVKSSSCPCCGTQIGPSSKDAGKRTFA